MVSCLRLTANVALFALWSVAVTASPINSVIDRISGHDTAGAQLVAAMMREMDINDRNQETFKDEFDAAIRKFKTDYSIDDDNKLVKSDDNDQIVCKNHVAQLDTLENDLKAKWKTVDAALKAKVDLLGQIRNLLNNEDDENGLHCGENNSAGAAELCTLLGELDKACNNERLTLDDEINTLDTYHTNIGSYTCDCKMGDWGAWSMCNGGDLQDTTVWTNECNVDLTENDPANANCSKWATCGNGTQSVTRTQEWAPKNGIACDVAGGSTQTVGGEENVQGTLSELSVGAPITQTFTRKCSEGEWNGACPIDCKWGQWIGAFTDHDCEVNQCVDDEGNRESSKRTINRAKDTVANYGGKPCFATQEEAKGPLLKDSKHQTCYFDDAAAYEKTKLQSEKSQFETKADKLIKEMCKDTNGPCQNDATCNVQYSTDNQEVTSWCECSDGWTGDWCEKATAPAQPQPSPQAQVAKVATWLHFPNAMFSNTAFDKRDNFSWAQCGQQCTVAECKEECEKVNGCNSFEYLKNSASGMHGECSLQRMDSELTEELDQTIADATNAGTLDVSCLEQTTCLLSWSYFSYWLAEDENTDVYILRT